MTVKSEQPAIEADSLAQLAGKLGIPADMLERTVGEYNAACVDGQFDPRRVDGLATRGLNPPKSNWARPLNTAPFKAYPIVSSIVFTFGGLKIDPRSAQVQHVAGRAIPGLYAAGEMAGGLWVGNYASGSGMMAGATFGRVAGTGAANAALQA